MVGGKGRGRGGRTIERESECWVGELEGFEGGGGGEGRLGAGEVEKGEEYEEENGVGWYEERGWHLELSIEE